MADQTEQLINVQQDMTTVEDYKFEPITGYPMLRWAGKRPFRSTQYFPAQLKENHGEPVNDWMNKIFWGDNLQVMSHLLKEYRGKVQLIYIDPPFDSKADYKKKIELRGVKAANDHTSFEEKQYSDLWTNDEYLQFMYERLVLCRELLHENGVLALHCDWHKNSYLKIMLDEIFGQQALVNEIIWRYETGGIPENFFSQKHDTIYVYSKTSDYIFNKTEASFPRNVCQNCNQKVDKWNNLKKHVDEDGRIYRTIKSNGKVYKYYDDEPVLLSDVWIDISHIQQKDPQRLDYPTQKPEALINRLVRAFSLPGDIVFDCFMGSGTTQAVAMKLGRRFIGADINLGAIQTATKRLIGVAKEFSGQLPEEGNEKYTGFSVYNVNNYDVFRNPVEAKDLLVKALEIQPLPGNALFDGEKDGRFVKIMPVNRIATKADLNELISNFDYKAFEKAQTENPGKPVAHITLVCMGHEPDLAAALQEQVQYKLDIEVLDILRNKSNLEFKRDAEAEIVKENGKLVIKQFYPMNLLQKLSLQKETVGDWCELVESIMVDFNYDGAVFEPTTLDVPEKDALVSGSYEIPANAGTIRVKITDLLSESLEMEVR